MLRARFVVVRRRSGRRERREEDDGTYTACSCRSLTGRRCRSAGGEGGGELEVTVREGEKGSVHLLARLDADAQLVQDVVAVLGVLGRVVVELRRAKSQDVVAQRR